MSHAAVLRLGWVQLYRFGKPLRGCTNQVRPAAEHGAANKQGWGCGGSDGAEALQTDGVSSGLGMQPAARLVFVRGEVPTSLLS